jgi:hypothetical protein
LFLLFFRLVSTLQPEQLHIFNLIRAILEISGGITEKELTRIYEPQRNFEHLGIINYRGILIDFVLRSQHRYDKSGIIYLVTNNPDNWEIRFAGYKKRSSTN